MTLESLESRFNRRLYVRLPGTPETWVDGLSVTSVTKVGDGIFVVTLECGAEHETEVKDPPLTAEDYLGHILYSVNSGKGRR